MAFRPNDLLPVALFLLCCFVLLRLNSGTSATSTSVNNFAASGVIVSENGTNLLNNVTCINGTHTIKKEIFNRLMGLQNRRFEPQDHVSTKVKAALYPLRLISVDDARGTLQVDFTIRLYWNDPRLEWQTLLESACPQTYGDADYLNVDFADVWTPPFSIAEAVLVGQQNNELQQSFRLMNIRHDGTVRYRGRFQGELMCAMSLRYYPFDEQVCNATIVGPFVIYENKWNDQSDAGIRDYYDNQVYETRVYSREMSTSEWELNPSDAKIIASISRPILVNTTYETSVSFRLYLTRNPWQHVMTWVIPPCMLTTISIAGLYCGCSTEERFGFGSSIIVTLSVLINQLHERLAASRDGLPLLSWLYLGLFTSFVMATATSNMPRAISRRILEQRGRVKPATTIVVSMYPKKSKDRSKERRQSLFTHYTWHFNTEHLVNFAFAGGYLTFQISLMIFISIMWALSPEHEVPSADNIAENSTAR